MKNNWKIKKRKYKEIIDQLLYCRGVEVSSKEEKRKFLDPDFDSDFFDAKKLSDFEAFSKRINCAVKTAEKVGIFADYDADGIPGAALLYNGLLKLGIKPVVFIPSRDQGYGLSREGADYLIDKEVSLIITVDLGIRNYDEADYIKSRGVDLIITDHHVPGDKLPKAIAVVNSKLNRYPFADLSGAGVVFKLLFGLSKIYKKELTESFLKWNLDLVAISTISDVVPLISENRIIAKFGIKVLRKTKNIGISELMDSAEIDRSKIGSYDVGYKIGPRINAPGRVDHATKSFVLLTTTDRNEAKLLADDLSKTNVRRQEQMKKLEKEAVLMIKESKQEGDNIIVVLGDWQKGVLGPSASNLANLYGRPVVIFSKNENELVGSARSFGNIDILKLISEASDYIDKFGGHVGAAGLTVFQSMYEKFYKKIKKIARKNISKDDLVRKYVVDVEINLSEVNLQLYDNISRMEPFGMGNDRPLFLARGVEITQHKIMGSGHNHFSCRVKREGGEDFRCVYFGFKEKKEELLGLSTVDIIFSLNENNWRGERNLELNILDIDRYDKKK